MGVLVLMAWETLTFADILSGSGAKTVGRSLWRRQMVLRGKAFSFPILTLLSTASTTYTIPAAREVLFPEYFRGGEKIRLYAYVYRSGLATSAEMRLTEAGGTIGTTATTSSLTPDLIYSDLTVPDVTWASAWKTLQLNLKVTGAGTAYVSQNDAGSPVSVIAGNLRMVYP